MGWKIKKPGGIFHNRLTGQLSTAKGGYDIARINRTFGGQLRICLGRDANFLSEDGKLSGSGYTGESCHVGCIMTLKSAGGTITYLEDRHSYCAKTKDLPNELRIKIVKTPDMLDSCRAMLISARGIFGFIYKLCP